MPTSDENAEDATFTIQRAFKRRRKTPQKKHVKHRNTSSIIKHTSHSQPVSSALKSLVDTLTQPRTQATQRDTQNVSDCIVVLDNIDQIANTLQHNNMTSSTSKTSTSYINVPQPSTSTPQPSTTTNLQRTQNFSRRMHDITHQKYALTYQIKSQESTTRLQLALAWSKLNPQGTDEILKLQKGFLLKTNLPQQQADSHLMSLIATKTILNYSTLDGNYRAPLNTSSTPNYEPSYSVVISQMESEITDEEISNHLNNQDLQHRYCKRIVSRATNQPTLLIRVITSSEKTFEKLLSEGVYFMYKHYPVYPSKAPTPIPTACNKCGQFTHTTDNCSTPVKCLKCSGAHKTDTCSTQLPPKCGSCGLEGHVAWSMKCPKRPTKPIAGIPNVKIRTVNKKSNSIDQTTKLQHPKLHAPITLHDSIINNYTSKINNPKNIDRAELLKKLKHKYITENNVDTTAVFSGTRMYILMFDLDLVGSPTATQPQSTEGVVQIECDGIDT